MKKYITKDSGKRSQYKSGMQRDLEEGKPRFDLIMPKDIPYDEQLITRLANLFTRGAEKYNDRNWEKATGEEELKRFKASAFRHFIQWISGEEDEDHCVAVIFNLQGAEYCKYKIKEQGDKK